MSVLWLYLSGLTDLQADQYPVQTEFRVHVVTNEDQGFCPDLWPKYKVKSHKSERK